MYRFKASECPYFEFYGVLIEFVCNSAKNENRGQYVSKTAKLYCTGSFGWNQENIKGKHGGNNDNFHLIQVIYAEIFVSAIFYAEF